MRTADSSSSLDDLGRSSRGALHLDGVQPQRVDATGLPHGRAEHDDDAIAPLREAARQQLFFHAAHHLFSLLHGLEHARHDAPEHREAATHFFENYQKDKNGARAADSLLFLSEAMVAIGDTNRACIALAEFSETYPALATGRLKEQYDRDRSKVTCRA